MVFGSDFSEESKIMNSVFKVVIGIFVLTVLSAQSAHSATISLSLDEPVAVLDMPLANATTGTVHEGLTATDIFHKSPWDGTSFAGAEYTSVQANSSATYLLGSESTQISFLWGSVDFFNRIIFKNDGVIVDYLTGTLAQDEGAPVADDFVQVTILAMAAFDEVIFESQQHAFEFANLALTAVPLPAALPLYAVGLVLLAMIGRKRSVKG